MTEQMLSFIMLCVGLFAGFVMHRSDFCLAGMFRDLFLFGSTHMLRCLALLVVISMAAFELARFSGILPVYPFFLLSVPHVGGVVGGAVFGVGMVLAGGCVVGTLYKMGAGKVVSVAAFIGLLAGSAAYAELHPHWVRLAKTTALTGGVLTIPQWMGAAPNRLVGPLALASGAWLLLGKHRRKWSRSAAAHGYLQPWAAAVILAILGLISYLVVGMPLGITTSYAKMAAWFENLFFPEHVRQVAFYSAVPLAAELPRLGIQLRGGPGPHWDSISAIQGPVVAGIVGGSLFSALLLKEFRIQYRIPGRQYLFAFLGGVLLAVGSRVANGCNVWHLLGGVPVLSLQSFLFVAGLLPGAWLGARLLTGVVLPESGASRT